MVVVRGYTLDSSLDQFAALLVEMDSVASNQARNAHAALSWVPGFEQLRFHPLLKKILQRWNPSVARYSDFCDPFPEFFRLVMKSPPSDIPGLRARLILLWRFLGLFRSIDLSHVCRTIWVRGEACYVRVKRKGQRVYSFERVMTLIDKHACPWHALLQYVRATQHLAQPKDPVLISLNPPYKPLTSNSIASISRSSLRDLGVDMSSWGPHSTRWDFVDFIRRLCLASEVVAEIGHWANLEAFGKHYPRLGAVSTAAREVDRLLSVHTASQLNRCRSECSQTPQDGKTRGGSEQERRHQSNGEPAHPSLDELSSSSQLGQKPEPSPRPNPSWVGFVPVGARTRKRKRDEEQEKQRVRVVCFLGTRLCLLFLENPKIRQTSSAQDL